MTSNNRFCSEGFHLLETTWLAHEVHLARNSFSRQFVRLFAIIVFISSVVIMYKWHTCIQEAVFDSS